MDLGNGSKILLPLSLSLGRIFWVVLQHRINTLKNSKHLLLLASGLLFLLFFFTKCHSFTAGPSKLFLPRIFEILYVVDFGSDAAEKIVVVSCGNT
jgi:hypothetical protein